MSAFNIPDDGFAKVTIGAATATVDVYELWNHIAELRDRLAAEDKPIREFHAGVVALLADRGFGTVSHRAADRLADALARAVDELGKAPAVEPTRN